MKIVKHAASYALLWMGVAIIADLFLVPLDMLMQHKPFIVSWLDSLATSSQPLLQLVETILICWFVITILLFAFFAIQKTRLNHLE